MFPKTVDVTQITGALVESSVTAWTVPNGDVLVEHLAGRAPNGDLLVFYWMPGQDWRLVNVTAITGAQVSGPVTSWVVPNGDVLVEHLAGRAPNGDLLVFYWMPGQDWRLVNVTAITGAQVSGPVTSWVVPNGDVLVEHLAGRAPNGDLLVFYWMPGQDWRLVNVTAITGAQVSGPVTSWVVPNGDVLVEHLAGRAPNGDLLVFYWMPGQDWRLVNVTAITGAQVSGPVTSWVVPNGDVLVEHLAGRAPNGDLLVFYWMPGQDWRLVNVSAVTDVQIGDTPFAYQVSRDGGVEELLIAPGADGALLEFWWSNDLDWQVADLRLATGVSYATSGVAWTVPDGAATIEHVAARTPDEHLVVAWFDAEHRRLTDGLVDTFPGLATHRYAHRRVVAILWDPKRPDHPAPPRADVEAAFTANLASVRSFFAEASLGRFSFEVVAFLPPAGPGSPDWYPAAHPASFYWGPPDVGDANGDGFVHGHTQKWAEAVWAASRDFDFSPYDVNGNGTMDPEDLLVCILIPQNGAEGYYRPALGQEYPTSKPLRSNGVDDGVVIPSVLEIYLGATPHVGLFSHELCHLLVGAADLYHGWPPESQYVPFTAGRFSLMSVGMPGDLDPFHRLKYGWLRHRLALRSGHYRLRSAVPHGEALVLLDKQHSTREYFVLENRSAVPGTCDASLPDEGLAVWHVIEDPAVFNASPTPTGTNPSYWAGTVGDWGRRGLRLLRPVVTPSVTDDTHGLWDGSDPATGYDLLSADLVQQHTQLRWVTAGAAGAPSGFAVRHISPAGPVVEFDLDVPW